MTPFWWGWPSWVVELLSGVLLAMVAALVVDAIFWQALVCVVTSYIYEEFFDRNGWSTMDFVQRAAGIAVGLWLWVHLR